MHKNEKVLALGLGIIVLLGGCNMGTDNVKSTETDTVAQAGEEQKISINSEYLVSVQDYTGEGYALRDGEETDKIAEDNREEIEVAVKKFFSEKYKTEVTVHNLVGAVDGVTVFVESVGEPHFYSFAIVPIDTESKEVKTDEVWSQDGQVEAAISGALYATSFEQEFKKLDEYFETITEKYAITGTPIEAIENVGAKGFTTPYYYLNPAGDIFDELHEFYLKNPNVNKQDIKDFLIENEFQPDDIFLTIYLYMKDSNTAPSQNIFDNIVTDIEKMEGIPRGKYSILLNDNYIDITRAIGVKQNTLERSVPNEIIKN